ncbi:MAG TPA: pyrroline-5-carboxylate reductase [Tepidisphaeraceae bacterium]|nr:pyrroline-5-carboxylate reductase [Tepidisphaeraceae bacterium]
MYELGIIGAGNMAEAIARAVVARDLFRVEQIIAADVSPQRRELFERELKVRAVEQNDEVVRESRIVLLSVKPQQMATVLAALAPALSVQTLIVSIAAGISTSFIERHLGAGKTWRVVRVMPNTPMLVGEGMSGIARGANASDDDVAKVRRIFESAGDVIEVAEDRMNAVTALSGSGPAYFFLLVEQMIAAGVEMGLSPQDARQLAAKTALGAARMLVASPEAPGELRRRVTSPAGTTHAAIAHLQAQNVPQAIIEAIKAADRRGRELGS